MRPFKRVKMLNADEYRVLKRALASRKIAAGKARRAKIVLLSNQGLTARERTLYPPNSTFGGCVSTRSRDIVVKANRWKENPDGKADRHHAGHRRRRHRDPVGEWVQPDTDHGDYSFVRQARSGGLVLGRKTYEGLAGYWPSQSGKWAD